MDEELVAYRATLQRQRDRELKSDQVYTQGSAEGLSFALDIFDAYFGKVE